jgi:peptide-methionine (S)-S-oxide reductase
MWRRLENKRILKAGGATLDLMNFIPKTGVRQPQGWAGDYLRVSVRPRYFLAVFTSNESNQEMEIPMAKAIFAAGCFWGVEATFRQIPGVVATRVGYIGGKTQNPTYKDVCSDETGHAEAVEVEYDPTQVSYDKLLKVFWENHDPTQLNRQGPDWGTQYRSAIFFTTPEQEKEAKASKEAREKSGAYRKPLVTQIVPEVAFYPAEDYHQQYLEKRGMASCHIK